MSQTLNVLVVDDEQIVIDSIKKLLRKENYDVYGVLSVEEALDKMKQVHVDIILTDLMMPDIDGLEFMRMTKDEHPNLPVIMITGYATINTALQATQLGAFDYVAKPFTRKELHGVLKRASEMVTTSKLNSNIDNTKERQGVGENPHMFKSVKDNAWLMLEENGIVLMGIEHSFLQTLGKVQNIYLPSVGDELRQGSSYLQIMSTDLRSHTLLSPLSGTVVEVNQKVIDDPDSSLQDPFGEGWLIRLRPSRFDLEIKEIGL